jgi:hypothetical protein
VACGVRGVAALQSGSRSKLRQAPQPSLCAGRSLRSLCASGHLISTTPARLTRQPNAPRTPSGSPSRKRLATAVTGGWISPGQGEETLRSGGSTLMTRVPGTRTPKREDAAVQLLCTGWPAAMDC